MRARWILVAMVAAGCAQEPALGEQEAESLVGFVPPASNLYKISGINSGRCLGVEGTQFVNGANVNQYTCGQTGLQAWSIMWDGACTWCARIRTGVGFCLEASANGRLHIDTCSAFNTTTQIFRLDDSAVWPGFHMVQLRSRDGVQCLDVPSGGTANGERINLFNCHGGENQTWLLEPRSDQVN